MNTNQYTQKTLEALQAAQQLAGEYQHNALEPEHLSFSPIKGPEGNIEYLLHLQKKPEGAEVQSCLSKDPETVVKEAHQQLD